MGAPLASPGHPRDAPGDALGRPRDTPGYPGEPWEGPLRDLGSILGARGSPPGVISERFWDNFGIDCVGND